MDTQSATKSADTGRQATDREAARPDLSREAAGDARLEGNPGVKRLAGLRATLNGAPRAAQLKAQAQSLNQRAADRAPAPIQRRANATGLPDALKTGVEALSGIALDDVRVHYGSAEPARLQALAFTRGTDIHVAPGQERHLPHEAWHVVQQAQGRVRPTTQMKSGVQVNDDAGLEREADVMGGRALARGRVAPDEAAMEPAEAGRAGPATVAQLRPFITRAGLRDTNIGYQALHQDVLPRMISECDGHGMAHLYVALNEDAPDDAGECDLLLEQIEMAARVLMAHLLARPDAARLVQLGVLHEPRIKFWLSVDYPNPPPHNLSIGIIAESLSAEIQLAKHVGADVVSGLKVGVPEEGQRGGFRSLAEIDNLTVRQGPRGLVPIELVEAKAGEERTGMQLGRKVAKLRLVARGEARLYLDNVDVTAQYDLTALNQMATTGSSSAADSAQRLDRGEIDQLYGELLQLQNSGYESLRVLAI